MRVAVLSASLGGLDEIRPWTPQSLPGHDLVIHRWDDTTFPPRRCMSPRLQARIPKMFGWQMAPGAHVYAWVDACYTLTHERTVAWLLDELGESDFACYTHPARYSIAEENAFIKTRIETGDEYLRRRYEGELGDEELEEIASTGYVDDRLYASGILVYRNNGRIQETLRDWWYHTSRYHVVDQLGLPFVLHQHDVEVSVLPGDYYNPTPYFRRWRHAS